METFRRYVDRRTIPKNPSGLVRSGNLYLSSAHDLRDEIPDEI